MAAYLTQKRFLSLTITTVILAVYLIFSPLTPVQAAEQHFFYTNLLPPPEGMYLGTSEYFAYYYNGIVIRNWCNRLFSSSIVPPLPGYPVTHSFSTKAEFEISFDGGSTWQPVEVDNASETVYILYQSTVDGNDIYSAEVTSLTVSGGGLPAGVQIRESPILSSTGNFRIKSAAGGYRISSFFDIYTEVSTDYGMSWWPSGSAGRVELKLDPQLIPPISAASQLLPSPMSQDVSTRIPWQSYASGIVLKNVRNKLFSDSNMPPALGYTQTHTFNSQLDFLFSTDGGLSFSPARAPGMVTVKTTNIREFQGRSTYQTEMIQLDISGGDLPMGVRIRESPTKVSEGGVSMVAGGGGGGAGGGAAVSSFFDVWLELSTDGGGSWYSDPNGPARVEIQAIGREELFSDPNVPPIGSEYYCAEPCFASFASGIKIADFIVREFSNSFPLPPMGNTVTHSYSAEVKMLMSTDGGITFVPAEAPAAVTMQITGKVHSADANYYDTEMTQLDISGGGLPAGVMIRESPTKASSGRISQRATGGGGGGGGYQVDSFFDIFTEVSTDGGQSWTPTTSGPGTVIIRPQQQVATTGHFFDTNLLPPPKGMYPCTDPCFAVYMNGIMVRNWCNRLFSSSVPPPLPGYPITHSFSGKAEFEISFDYGTTWLAVEVNNVSETMWMDYNSISDGNTEYYDTEMTQLDISGGGLPAGVQIRESPTQTSAGQTTIKPIPGGYQISSFFDIYTEVSTDGGMTWTPVAQPGHVELKVDPALVPPVDAPGTVLPMPNGQYVSPAAWHQAYQNGIIITDVRHKLFTDWNEPPVLGQTETHTFGSQADFKVSLDGGMSFMPVRAPATMTVKISNVREFQGRATYETEATQLDISGGDLPAGVQIRESPTRVSEGGTSMVAGGGGGGAGGGTAISSFFDIFTEVSTDGGASWYSDTNGPAHVELQAIGKEELFSDPNVPPIGSEYYCPDPCFALFASGVQLDNFMLRDFSHSFPLPPEGNTVTHSFGATAKMLVSLNGGLTFTPMKAPAAISMSVTGKGHSDDVNYYDTEMTQLDISGGGLPAGVMIRESPTKASSGRISQRATGGGGGGGGYQVDSFFDIFTEVSTDGGQSWMPSSSGPGTIIIRHDSCNKCSNFNGIGLTNMNDFSVLAKNWRWAESPGNAVNIADLDCDGDVELFDLDIFVDSWLLACP